MSLKLDLLKLSWKLLLFEVNHKIFYLYWIIIISRREFNPQGGTVGWDSGIPTSVSYFLLDILKPKCLKIHQREIEVLSFNFNSQAVGWASWVQTALESIFREHPNFTCLWVVIYGRNFAIFSFFLYYRKVKLTYYNDIYKVKK